MAREPSDSENLRLDDRPDLIGGALDTKIEKKVS